MLIRTGFGYFWLATTLLLACAGARAEQRADDQLARVKKQADSIVAVFRTALATKDSALLASSFGDTAGVLLPGNKALDNKTKIVKYLPLFLETFEGCELNSKRIAIEAVRGFDDLAREAGTYSLTRKSESGQVQEWRGEYTVYWRYHDSSWAIERLFVSKK